MTSGWLGDRRYKARRARRRENAIAPSSPPEEENEECLAVLYVPVRCPTCKSRKTRCYNSGNAPIRYHICHACQTRFKSIETTEAEIRGAAPEN